MCTRFLRLAPDAAATNIVNRPGRGASENLLLPVVVVGRGGCRVATSDSTNMALVFVGFRRSWWRTLAETPWWCNDDDIPVQEVADQNAEGMEPEQVGTCG